LKFIAALPKYDEIIKADLKASNNILSNFPYIWDGHVEVEAKATLIGNVDVRTGPAFGRILAYGTVGIYMSGTIIHSLGVPKPDTTRFNRDL